MVCSQQIIAIVINKVTFKRFMVAICINPKASFILVSSPDLRKTPFNHSKETFLMPHMC